MAMNRRRQILPELFTNENLLALPVEVRLTAIGLHLYADDEGRASATPQLIKAALWPMDRNITAAKIDDFLLMLDEADFLELYSAGSRTYYSILVWPRVDRPTPSVCPAPPPRDPLANRSRFIRESIAVEEEREEREARSEEEHYSHTPPDETFTGLPPSPFCKTHPNGTDAPCRNCGTARLRHQRWLEAQLDNETQTPPRSRPAFIDPDEPES